MIVIDHPSHHQQTIMSSSGFARPGLYDLNKSQYETFLTGKAPKKSLLAAKLKREDLSKQADIDIAADQAAKYASKFGSSCGDNKRNHAMRKKEALTSFLNDVKHAELISHGQEQQQQQQQQQQQTSQTTNIFLTNVSLEIDAHRLRLRFERYGRIASVKIFTPSKMIPVPVSQNGFVAYFERHDAEKAMDALTSNAGVQLDDRYLGGGWGKKLNAEVMQELRQKDDALRQMIMGSNDSRASDTGGDGDGGGDGDENAGGDDEDTELERSAKRQKIMAFDEKEEEASRFRIGAFLTTKDQHNLSALLKALDLRKTTVTATMMFCLKHSYAATHVVNIICENSFFHRLKEQCCCRVISAPKQIAAFYLISDLLSNSSCAKQGASVYRTSIEENLVDIMTALRETHSHIRGRITAGAMEARISKVLDTWNTWGVFTTRFVEELKSMFARGTLVTSMPVATKSSNKNSTVVSMTRTEAAGEDEEDEDEDDLDGEPLNREEQTEERLVDKARQFLLYHEGGAMMDDDAGREDADEDEDLDGEAM